MLQTKLKNEILDTNGRVKRIGNKSLAVGTGGVNNRMNRCQTVCNEINRLSLQGEFFSFMPEELIFFELNFSPVVVNADEIVAEDSGAWQRASTPKTQSARPPRRHSLVGSGTNFYGSTL